MSKDAKYKLYHLNLLPVNEYSWEPWFFKIPRDQKNSLKNQKLLENLWKREWKVPCKIDWIRVILFNIYIVLAFPIGLYMTKSLEKRVLYIFSKKKLKMFSKLLVSYQEKSKQNASQENHPCDTLFLLNSIVNPC